ncbi:MAG: DUF370 domain-containing protein [Desulfovibrio sp.]|nr:DUF370 domain-containing protein [Desulfovibrio sp.]
MPEEKLLNVGFGNYIVAARIVAIINPTSQPMRRMREDAQTAGRLIDATQGRRTRSIIVLDSEHLVLSSIQPDTLRQRFTQEDTPL